MFKSIENKTISQSIVEQIQEMILCGKLKSNDKLPPERQMTEMFGVSRPALREALKALEAVGLISRRQGQGNFISSNIGNMLYKPLPLYYKLNDGSFEDIVTMREVIEAYTIGESSAKATEEDIAGLYDICNKMISEQDFEKRVEYDWLVHFEIAKISGNKLVVVFLESISHLYNSFINMATQEANMDNSTERINKDHIDIIKAIESRQPEEGIRILREGLRAVKIKPEESDRGQI